MQAMLARAGENGFLGCPIRTSGPIRPSTFARAARFGIYYGVGPLGGSHERPEENRSTNGRGSDWDSRGSIGMKTGLRPEIKRGYVC